MCQSRAEGGRRCAVHLAATRGSKVIAASASGLSKSQLNAVFSDLRAEGRNQPEPTVEQYSAFLQRQFNSVNQSRLDTDERAAVRRTLTSSTEENLPDGPTFYALRRLTSRSRSQARAIRREVVNLAPRMGVSASTAIRVFNENVRAQESTSAMSTETPRGYGDDDTQQARESGIPSDRATARAYANLRDAANNPESNPNISTERRITRREVNGSFISEIGYDPSDGRLEVKFRSSDVVYAYRNVPASTWAAMNAEGASVGSIYSRQVRNNPDHAYASREESESDAYARRCPNCGQFAAASHSCPQSRGELSEEQVQAFINEGEDPDDATPSLDANDEQGAQEVQEELETAEANLVENDGEATPRRRRATTTRTPRAPRQTAAERRMSLPLAERETLNLVGSANGYNYIDFPRNDEEASHDILGPSSYFYTSPSTRIRAGVNRGQAVSANFNYTCNDPQPVGERYGRPYHRYQITGAITLYSDGNEWKADGSNLKCDCSDYAENYRCRHIDGIRSERSMKYVAGIYEKKCDESGYNRRRAVAQAAESGQTPTVTVSRARRARRASDLFPGENVSYRQEQPEGGMSHCEYDSIYTGSSSDIRSALAVGNAIVPIDWSGYRPGAVDEYGRSSRDTFNVSGNVTLSRDAEGNVTVTDRQLRCYCVEYRRDYRCIHVDYIANSSTRFAATASTATNPAVAHQAAEEALRRDWTRNDEHRADMDRRHASVVPEDSYSQTFESFQTDFSDAQSKITAGESPVPFRTENVTNGICAPGGRKFGVELEFDLNGVANKRETLRAIGRELHEAGLTPSPDQRPYHSAAASNYAKWSFETDATVDAEIVSPIMHDTPEHWAELKQVCDIVKRHGGVATARTGSHVHVSTGSYGTDITTHAELAKMVQQHEDTIYRMSSNPEARQHRSMTWCAPNTNLTDSHIDQLRNNERNGTGYYRPRATQLGSGHNLGLNFQSAGSGNAERDNVEFRQWDGTLDPAVIQAQIMMSAGMAEAAERNVRQHGLSTAPREPVGSHKTRLQQVVGRSRRALTADELKEDSATTRSFIDTICSRREDKKILTGLFAMTKWQSGGRSRR